MKRFYPGKLLICLFAVGLMFTACKQIDMERVPYVVTSAPDPVYSTSATANGVVSDLGDGIVSEYGFCYDVFPNIPDVDGPRYYYNGSPESTGEYQIDISGLAAGTKYYIRAYMETTQGRVYGSSVEFVTSGGSTPNPRWFSYYLDDAQSGVGRTGGGNFDAAIRIPASELSNFQGFNTTKIAFYAWDPDPGMEYYLVVWEGSLTNSEWIVAPLAPNVTAYDWNEYTLPIPVPVNVTKDLWFGIYVVNQPQGVFPLGVDSGPNMEPFYSDLYSPDEGANWVSISQEYQIDKNWVIQGYVTNQKGEEFSIGYGGIKPVERPSAIRNTKQASAIESKMIKK